MFVPMLAAILTGRAALVCEAADCVTMIVQRVWRI